MVSAALVLAVALTHAPVSADSALTLSSSARSASLMQQTKLEGHWQPARTTALRLVDDIRMLRSDNAVPLDQGGGVSSDVRGILAALLGFFPGFGIGHLIAKDRNGFILFLIIDIVLVVLYYGVGWYVFTPFRFIGGLVWLLVHIYQAIDAYGAATGDRIVNAVREQAVRIASVPGRRDEPAITTRLFKFDF